MSYSKTKIPLLNYDTKSINQDVPIEDVIAAYAGEHVGNTRGKNIRCPSPNHNDKKPSAHIYHDRNICKCFSCGGNFTPINLAKEYFPDLPFPELCRKVIDDFHLNPYMYSNLGEVEAAQSAHNKNKFFDVFPLDYNELDFIGLHGATQAESEVTYAVSSLDYFNHFYGEIPRCAYDEVFGANGEILTMNITAGEAADMGLIERAEKHEYRKNPSIRDLWASDKKGVEQMMLGKCHDKLDELHEQLFEKKDAVENYRARHTSDDTRKAEKLRSAYIGFIMEGRTVQLKPEQEKSINEFCEFESNKSIIGILQKEIKQANAIASKITEHQKERNKALKEHRYYGRE